MSDEFDKAMDELFGGGSPFPTLPSDAYEVIRSSMIESDYKRYVANHFHIHTAVPYAFEDYDGLVEVSTLAGRWQDTPRLAKSLQRIQVASFGNNSDIDMHFVGAKNHGLMNTRELLAKAATRAFMQTPDYFLMDASERKQAIRGFLPDIGVMQNANLSQHARSIQMAAWQKARYAFVTHVIQFAEWAQNHSLNYSLRMPIAMNPSARDNLLKSSPTGGINMVEAYQTASQNELLTQVYDAGLTEKLFGPPLNALGNREEFLKWDSLAAAAHAVTVDGIQVAIIPACLPPWLLYGTHYSAPYYLWAESLGTYTEQAVAYTGLHLADIDKPVNLFIDDNQIHFIARNLSVLCMGLTLWATQIKLGTGHRVPAWTGTPMNPVTIKWFIDELAALNQEWDNV